MKSEEASPLEAALRLGEQVLKGALSGGSPSKEVVHDVELVRTAVYGPDPGPAAAPWAPPGLPIPRLWAGAEASPFALLLDHRVGDGQGSLEAARKAAQRHRARVRPLIQAEVRRLVRARPVAGAELAAVVGSATEARKPGWLREEVRQWVVGGVVSAVEGVKAERAATPLAAALTALSAEVLAQVPEKLWAPFLLGDGDSDPADLISDLVWQEAENEARFRWAVGRALRVAKIAPGEEAPTDEPGPADATCCGTDTASDDGCFRVDDPITPSTSENLSAGRFYPETVAQARLADRMIRELAETTGGDDAGRLFVRAFFGAGLGDQLAALAQVPPTDRPEVVGFFVPSLTERRKPIEIKPLERKPDVRRSQSPIEYHPYQETPAPPPSGCCPDGRGTVGTVTIFGAGIAGLTAAHELAERGFAVQVVEKAHANKGARAFPLVGGMARTQWGIEDGGDQGRCCNDCEGPSRRLLPTTSYKLALGLPVPIIPGRIPPHWRPRDPGRLSVVGPVLGLLGQRYQARLLVRAGETRLLPKEREAAVETLAPLLAGLTFAAGLDVQVARQAAQVAGQLDLVDEPTECETCGRTKKVTAEDAAEPAVGTIELVMACGIYPGEHGYRFFPSFYRHVFDTMKRTPVYTSEGVESRYTTFDNLVSTYQQVFAGDERGSVLTRDRPASFEAFRREYVALLEKLGFEKRDITRMMFRMFRFLTTSTHRRAAEFEDITWWDFLVGATREDRTPRWAYSPDFEHHLKASPQALGGVDATWGDARTQGNIVVQLLLDQVSAGGPTDSTLNGPTSLAWLELWKLHLQTLGVKFYAGTLRALCPPTCPPRYGQPPSAPNELVHACIDWPDREPPPCFCPATNYYILATDVVTAEEVTLPLRTRLRTHGVPGELDGFTTRVPRQSEALLPRRFFRLVAPDRLPDPGPNAVNVGVAHKVTDVDLLPLALERVAKALNRLRQLSVRHLGQLETQVLRNQPGEPRVARIVVEAVDPQHEIARDLAIIFGIEPATTLGLDPLLAQIRAWALGGLTAAQKAAFAMLKLFVEPEEDRLTTELTRVVRPGRRYGATPQDRLQTFAGIQYYFNQDLKVARGHIFFHDTEWGLSSISQLQFWRSRRILRDQGIRGILSVDIGDWRTPSRYLGKAALDCNAREIAEEVWRQISEALRRGSRFGPRAESLPIPQPTHWYLDEALVFGHLTTKVDPGQEFHCIKVTEDVCQPLIANQMPFLVNNVSDWVNRPGADPMDPDDLVKTDRRDEPYIWQAEHGGYQVHFGQLLFAGTYLRTFTRMTTMEAANESGRHAVNALLDHVTAFGARTWANTRFGDATHADAGKCVDGTVVTDKSTSSPEGDTDCRLDAKGVPLPVQAIAGDYCEVWDPEKHELDELAFFKRVDELLFRMGKPHFHDILGLDALVDTLHPESTSPGALLSAVIDTLKRDFSISTEEVVAGGKPVEDLLKSLAEKARAFLKARL